MRSLTNPRLALTALAVVGIAVVFAEPPHTRAILAVTLCAVFGGNFLLTYREDPGAFHRKVGRRDLFVMLLPIAVLIGIFIALSSL
jgi:hypothetical protein